MQATYQLPSVYHDLESSKTLLRYVIKAQLISQFLMNLNQTKRKQEKKKKNMLRYKLGLL